MTASERPPRIETARLVLRPFTLADVEDVYSYASDPEFRRYVPLPSPYLRVHAVAFVEQCIAERLAEQPEWAIEFEGHVIGAINLRPQLTHRRAGMGYGIAPAYWGRGLTTEAARAAVGWAFANLAIDRVFATADARNTGSWRVMEHLGMRREGVLRAHRMQEGIAADEVWYGLLRSEWGGQGGQPTLTP